MPNERPILFSVPMIQALLAGTKTQTRRVVNFDRVLSAEQKRAGMTISPEHATPGDLSWIAAIGGDEAAIQEERKHQQLNVPIRHPDDAAMDWPGCGKQRVYCPLGAPGDRLWVRETWGVWPGSLDEERLPLYRATVNSAPEG